MGVLVRDRSGDVLNIRERRPKFGDRSAGLAIHGCIRSQQPRRKSSPFLFGNSSTFCLCLIFFRVCKSRLKWSGVAACSFMLEFGCLEVGAPRLVFAFSCSHPSVLVFVTHAHDTFGFAW
jgi:hypothetical protein